MSSKLVKAWILQFSIIVLLFAQEQSKTDDKPPIKGKFWLYHRYVDREELEFIRKFFTDLLSMPEFTRGEPKVRTDKVKTLAIRSPHFHIESDFLTYEQMKFVGKFLEATHKLLSEFWGVRDIAKECKYETFTMLIITKAASEAILASLGLKNDEERWGQILYNENGVLFGRALKYTKEETKQAVTWFAQHSVEYFVWSVFHATMPIGFDRLPYISLPTTICTLFGFVHNTGVYDPKNTGNPNYEGGGSIIGFKWTDKVLSVIKSNKSNPVLASIVEGTYNGVDGPTEMKLWAFADWLVLVKRDNLKSIIQDMKALRDKQDAKLTKEDIKRSLIESLEKSFGKKIDEIESEFETFVKERYFDKETAKKISKLSIWREVKMEEKGK